MNAVKGFAIAAVLAAPVALGACGDDDDEQPDVDQPEAAIVVSGPEPGASVRSPVTVAGMASVFEGTVQIRLRGEGGETIASEFTTASAGAPERGEFSKRVRFAVKKPEEGTVEVYEENVASGGEGGGEPELNGVTVPVTLEP